MSSSESEIQREIVKALEFFPDLLIWRNNTGRRGGITYGLSKGSADLVGLIRCDTGPYQGAGVFVALEIKAQGKKPDVDQVAWGKRVRDTGGFYAVVTSTKEAWDALIRAKRGDKQ